MSQTESKFVPTQTKRSVPVAVRDRLRETLGDLVFRRVARVKTSNLIRVTRYSDPDQMEVMGPDFDMWSVPADEWEKSYQARYSNFYAFTSTAALRQNDPFGGQPLYLTASRYAVLDPITLRFPSKTHKSQVPPRVGDLVCGLVVKPNQPNRAPYFTRWFICSEQFYRAWTLIMFDQHDSFKGRQPQELRKWLFSGNRLTTNNWYKWRQALIDQGQEPDPQESIRRYHHPRYETPARWWCHLYACYVLMARYGELPTDQNMPRTLEKGAPQMAGWHLPPDFVARFLAEWIRP